MNEPKTYTFHVSGTHCSACKHIIEETLVEQPDVLVATVSLAKETITLETTRTEDPEVLAEHLTSLIGDHGYTVHVERMVQKVSSKEWIHAAIAVALVLAGYIGLEKAGLTSLIGEGGTFTTAFIVGLVASVSTCLAVVGGLVLSVSATYAHEGGSWRPQALFHVGRSVGFFVLGGLLGALGEVMQIGFYGSVLLGVVASVVMLVLGVHLLDLTKKVRMFTLPKGISKYFIGIANRSGMFAPLILGAVTFFLPCGFTQSMQISALSSGSFVTGAMTMLIFSLGTLPVLALLSFGSLDLAKSRFRGTFFKAAGMLVILFALFNLHNALVVFGIIPPVISF